MLKHLAILVVLGTLATVSLLARQTTPPNPPENRITAQNTGKTGGLSASSQERNSNSPRTAPVNVQPVSAVEQKEATTDQENLDIQRKLEWFTGILAIVGVLQVLTMIWQAGLLRGTLKEIHTQAGHMEGQSKTLRDSVTAAQKAAEAADKSATAAMGIAVPTLILRRFTFIAQRDKFQYDSFLHPKVIIEVKNFGQSPAILKAYMLLFSWEDELPEEPVYDFPYPCDAEEVIDPGETHQLDPESTTANRETPLQIAYDLEAGKRRLTVYGFISYGDIFGSPIRYMKFSKRVIEFNTDGSYVMMIDYGGEKYTGQREHYDAPNKTWPKAN